MNSILAGATRREYLMRRVVRVESLRQQRVLERSFLFAPPGWERTQLIRKLRHLTTIGSSRYRAKTSCEAVSRLTSLFFSLPSSLRGLGTGRFVNTPRLLGVLDLVG